MCIPQKKYFKNISKYGAVINKKFWSIRKTFLTNNGRINWEEIILKTDNETTADNSVLVEMSTQIAQLLLKRRLIKNQVNLLMKIKFLILYKL